MMLTVYFYSILNIKQKRGADNDFPLQIFAQWAVFSFHTRTSLVLVAAQSHTYNYMDNYPPTYGERYTQISLLYPFLPPTPTRP